jgi:hypothetical protein
MAAVIALGGCATAAVSQQAQEPLALSTQSEPFQIPLVIDPSPYPKNTDCREDRKFHLRDGNIQYCFNGQWQTAFYSSQ